MKTTKQVAKELGIPVDTLQHAVWKETFQPPEKIGRAFVWQDSDIDRAKSYYRRKVIK